MDADSNHSGLGRELGRSVAGSGKQLTREYWCGECQQCGRLLREQEQCTCHHWEEAPENALVAMAIGGLSGLVFAEALITVGSSDRLPSIPPLFKGLGLLGIMSMLAQGRLDAISQLLGSRYIGVSSMAAISVGLLRLMSALR